MIKQALIQKKTKTKKQKNKKIKKQKNKLASANLALSDRV